ncbi:hypothetical protein RQP46_010092 [Phenoliferia psychrophenolica]
MNRGQCCSHCAVWVGHGTDIKYLLCGGCRGPCYCSKECSRANYVFPPPLHSSPWKHHKSFCHSIKNGLDTLETTALAHPLPTRVRTDLTTFETLAKAELWVFLRTILRLGRSDDIHKKETLVLSFDYGPTLERIRERFALRKATLLPTETFAASGSGEHWMFARKHLDYGITPNYIDSDDSGYVFKVLWTASYEEGGRTRSEYVVPRYDFDPNYLKDIFGPSFATFPLRPDWENQLRIALRGPDRPSLVQAWMDDIKASVDEERASRTISSYLNVVRTRFG